MAKLTRLVFCNFRLKNDLHYITYISMYIIENILINIKINLLLLLE